MKDVFPRVMRVVYTGYGRTRKCPNKDNAIRNRLLHAELQPKIGSYACRTCKYYLGVQMVDGEVYVGCSWLSDKEKIKL